MFTVAVARAAQLVEQLDLEKALWQAIQTLEVQLAQSRPQHFHNMTICRPYSLKKTLKSQKNGHYGSNENDFGNLAGTGSLQQASHKSQPARTRKPPVATKTSTSSAFGGGTPHDMQRASSVTMHEQPGAGGATANYRHQLAEQPSAPSSVTHYNAPEEPLRNPEL